MQKGNSRITSKSTTYHLPPTIYQRGFTLIELIVVVTIIGILATIVGLSYKNWQTSIVTAQLKSDLNGVASAMENARTFGNAYPSSIPATFEPSEGVTLSGGSIDEGETYCIDAISSRDESIRYYINSLSGTDGARQGICGSLNLIATTVSMTEIDVSWDAFIGASSYTLQRDVSSSFESPTITTQTGTAFTSSGLSVGTTYYYRVNVTIAGNTSDWSNTASATATTLTAPSAPAIAVTLNSGNVLATITPVTCTDSTTQYGIRSRTDDGTWGSYSAWSTDTTATQVATQGIKYGYQAQVRCYINGTSYSTTTEGTESTYIHPITTPAAPTVTANTVADTTTWSWTTPSCAAGTSAQYQYRYTITPSGSDSGWVDIASSPVAFTTNTLGKTYIVQIQARCHNANTDSSWGTPGQDSYYRPFISLTAIATISGATTAVGNTLTAGALTPSGATVTYQWQSAITAGGTYTNIASATASTYALVIGNVGKYIKVVATATGNYTGTQTSAASAVVSDSNWLAIGAQAWAKANLNVGTMISGATNQTNNAVLEKYCYANTASNCTTYGGLYQWDEAMQYVTTQGAQGICPTGSHIPSDNDFKILEMQLGMSQAQADSTGWRGTDQGTKLKPGGSSGLNFLLGGYRLAAGTFGDLTVDAYAWPSSESGTNALFRVLYSGNVTVGRSVIAKTTGFPVRCLGN